LPRHRLILRLASKPKRLLPLAIHTAAFGRFLVMLVAGLAIATGRVITLLDALDLEL
jgi:hypothetical protein